MVSLGYLLAQDKINKEIYQIGAALEIFQTAILSHDDIIDQSLERRGKPSLYNSLGNNHYGISQAICLSDLGFFLSNEIILNSNFSNNLKNLCQIKFSQISQNAVLGEMLDAELSFKRQFENELDCLKISELKTASYSFSGPLQIGAILGFASEKYLNFLEKFGQALGVAFQIQDDILGVFGDEKEMGKSSSSDIKEGKATILISYVLKKVSENDKKILNRLYGKKDLSADESLKVKEIFTKYGALDYANRKALEYTQTAKNLIPVLTQDKQKAELLTTLADYLVKRKS